MKYEKKKRHLAISCGTMTYRFGNTWEETEVLLVKQFSYKDSWGIPKGHLDVNETHEQCAIRETKEETGITVALEEKLPDMRVSYKNSDKLVISYLAKQICNQQPVSNGVDSEVADARWFKINEIPHIHSYQHDIIFGAIDKIREYFDERIHK